MRELIVWGGTGQAKVLVDAIDPQQFRLTAFFDNRDIPSPAPPVPIWQGEEGLRRFLDQRKSHTELCGVVAVAGARGADRLQLMELLKSHDIALLSIIHPKAHVASGVALGQAVQLLAGSIICTGTRLGDGVIVNTLASVDHDCVIEDGVHLAPGVRLAGEIRVGLCAFIGTGAIILPGISIGKSAVIGAGAVVTRDVADGATVVGNPARLIPTRI